MKAPSKITAEWAVSAFPQHFLKVPDKQRDKAPSAFTQIKQKQKQTHNRCEDRVYCKTTGVSRGDSAPSRSGNCLYALYVSSCLPAGPDPLCSSSTLWDLLWVQHPHLAHCAAQHSLLAICSSFTRHEPCQWDGRAAENGRATEHVWFEPSVLLREHLSYSNCVGKLTRPLYSCR